MTRSLVLSPSECWSKTIVVLLCTLAYCNGTCQGIILKICWDCLKLQTAAWLLMLSHEVSECVRKTARHLFFVPMSRTSGKSQMFINAIPSPSHIPNAFLSLWGFASDDDPKLRGNKLWWYQPWNTGLLVMLIMKHWHSQNSTTKNNTFWPRCSYT